MANQLIALFENPATAMDAAGRLKSSGFATPTVYSPIPLEGLEKRLGKKKSVIKRFSFFGAVLGFLAGFTLAAGTAIAFIHPTGGRPVITLPPFLVISYEITILFGILATVLGFLISARLPAIAERSYQPEVAIDRYGVAVSCEDESDSRRAESLLREAGAEKVEPLEGTS